MKQNKRKKKMKEDIVVGEESWHRGSVVAKKK